MNLMKKTFNHIEDWFDFEKNIAPKYIYDRLRASHIADTQKSLNVISSNKIFIRHLKLWNTKIQRIILVFIRL